MRGVTLKQLGKHIVSVKRAKVRGQLCGLYITDRGLAEAGAEAHLSKGALFHCRSFASSGLTRGETLQIAQCWSVCALAVNGIGNHFAESVVIALDGGVRVHAL